MARLIAQHDILVDHPETDRGAQLLIARKGQVVPTHLAYLIEDKKATAAEGTESAADEDATGPGYEDMKVDELKAMVAERGLEPESQRKQDLIDALEADDADGSPVVNTEALGG